LDVCIWWDLSCCIYLILALVYLWCVCRQNLCRCTYVSFVITWSEFVWHHAIICCDCTQNLWNVSHMSHVIICCDCTQNLRRFYVVSHMSHVMMFHICLKWWHSWNVTGDCTQNPCRFTYVSSDNVLEFIITCSMSCDICLMQYHIITSSHHLLYDHVVLHCGNVLDICHTTYIMW